MYLNRKNSKVLDAQTKIRFFCYIFIISKTKQKFMPSTRSSAKKSQTKSPKAQKGRGTSKTPDSKGASEKIVYPSETICAVVDVGEKNHYRLIKANFYVKNSLIYNYIVE